MIPSADTNKQPVPDPTEDNMNPLLIVIAATLAYLLSTSWIITALAVALTIAVLVTVDTRIHRRTTAGHPQLDAARS